MMKSKKDNIAALIVFSIMLIYLLMQFSKVMVYFDDYGYYSLSYSVDNAVGGHSYSFGELLSFLHKHYYGANGRLPGYLLWLSLFMVGGLQLVQNVAAVLVLAILIAVWKFIAQKKYKALSAAIVCAFYGLFSINMQHQGTYWFAAFFQYIAPMCLVYFFVILYFKHRETGFSIGLLAAMILFLFFASYSQEQLAVTMIFMMCLLLIFEVMQKNIKMHNFIFLIVAVAGFILLMSSPSSQNRASGGSYTLLETIIYSTYKTIRMFFAADIAGLVSLLYIALLSFSLIMLKKDNLYLKLIDLCGIVLAVVSILIYVIEPVRNLFAQVTLNRYYLLIVAGVPTIALIAIQIMRYYWSEREFSRLLLFMTAVGSVGCLCVLPEVPARLLLPSWFMLFPLLADGVFISTSIIQDSLPRIHKYYLVFISAAIVFLAGINAYDIYYGYALNAEVYRYNDKVLSVAAETEKTGLPVEKVYLKIMPAPEYAAALIYHDEVTYMKGWMKQYYDFEVMPSFYFNESGMEDNAPETYVEQGNKIFLKQN